MKRLTRPKNWSIWTWLIVLYVVALALAGVWNFTPLKNYANPEYLQQMSAEMRGEWWTPPVLLGVYVLASATLFPNMVVNAAVILTFGGFYGWFFAITGSLLSATVFFIVGRRYGSKRLQAHETVRFQKVAHLLRKRGIGTVFFVRLLPVAPFTAVNSIAGALGIRYWHFVVGTVLALLPGTITTTLFREQLSKVIVNADIRNILTLFAVILIGAVAIVLARRYARRKLRSAD